MPKQLASKLPVWADPEQSSVLDPLHIALLRKAVGVLGLNDPNTAIESMVNPMAKTISIPANEFIDYMRRIPPITRHTFRAREVSDIVGLTNIGSGPIARLLSEGKTWNTQLDPLRWRATQEEIYKRTQDILKAFGAIDPKTKIRVYRGGVLSSKPGFLAPTSIAKDHAFYKTPFREYEVPRKDVKAAVGLMRPGDDISAAELLVPSGVLQRTTEKGQVPIYPTELDIYTPFSRPEIKAKPMPHLDDLIQKTSSRSDYKKHVANLRRILGISDMSQP